MFSRLLRKKRVLAGAVVATLALAGGAFAYFSSTGSGTGYATVGSAHTWGVAVAAPELGPLYPGSGEEYVHYTVTNESGGPQQLKETTAALTHDGSNQVYDLHTSSFVAGCYTGWFTVTNSDVGLAASVSAGGSYTTGYAKIVLNDSGTNQNPCQGVAPQVTVEAS